LIRSSGDSSVMASAFHEIRSMPESLGNDSSIRLATVDDFHALVQDEHVRRYSRETRAASDILSDITPVKSVNVGKRK
jgi:hypothetical protein